MAQVRRARIEVDRMLSGDRVTLLLAKVVLTPLFIASLGCSPQDGGGHRTGAPPYGNGCRVGAEAERPVVTVPGVRHRVGGLHASARRGCGYPAAVARHRPGLFRVCGVLRRRGRRARSVGGGGHVCRGLRERPRDQCCPAAAPRVGPLPITVWLPPIWPSAD